jgi:NhaP-type Na+/H+ or K+/H+ antiporter
MAHRGEGGWTLRSAATAIRRSAIPERERHRAHPPVIPPLLFIALAGLAYALVSARLATSVISTPLFFVGLGLLAGPALDLVALRPDSELLVRFLEAALGMMLFVDASSLDLRNVSLKAALAGRLLGIGLPLTVIAGALVAVLLWPGIELWQAALVGAMLAPTDALLAHAAVADPRVPAIVRNALNVEGGLNDGLALPLVTILIAIGLAAIGVDTQVRAVQTLVVVVAGSTILGLVVALAGGGLLRAATRRGLVAPSWWSIGPAAIAVAAFVAADRLGASGFLAVWMAGLAMGMLFRRADEAKAFGLSVALADGLVAIAFLLMGTALLGPVLARITSQTVIYAVLSLTVVRMLPVAIATLRSGFAPETVLYVGWFGPRGLVSVVFADVVVGQAVPAAQGITDVVLTTVALSIVVHGITAAWGARRYAAWFELASRVRPGMPEAAEVSPHSLTPRQAPLGGSEPDNAVPRS